MLRDIHGSFSDMGNTIQSDHQVLEMGNTSTASDVLAFSGTESFYEKGERQVLPVPENYRKDASTEWVHRPPEYKNGLSSTVPENSNLAEAMAYERKITAFEQEKMISVMRHCYFEPGEWTAADQLFENMKKDLGTIDKPLELLSEIVIKHLNDEHILEGVLHILSNYDYEEIEPTGIVIAAACCFNQNVVIQDLLISCFETWDTSAAIPVLETMEFGEIWLKKYRDDVINQLKNKDISA